MPHDDTGSHDESLARGSSVGPAHDADSSASGASSHGSMAIEPDLADQTVISTTPPLELQPTGRGLKPHELGRALEGHQLDHVRLEEFVGGGGMGAVFRGWDTDLHRTVAVKVLSTYQAGDAESARRFQLEARSAARLDHPNIARVHYVGEDDGVRYIVFEYIDGTNVRDMVMANGPFSLADALNFTMQIAGALSHAWQRDVVHRDIKPSNILITHDGTAKLVDMGLARLEQVDQTEHEQTATGVTLGTFDYISPEQARDSRMADTRSDIYSLGCTLFFMLTSQPPFPSGTVLQKLLAHQSDEPPNVRSFRPEVTESLAGVINRMLAKRPEDRFQLPDELVAALVACGAEIGIAPPQGTLPAYWAGSNSQARGWQKHAPWLVTTALLFATVLGLGIWWNAGQKDPVFTELQIPPSRSTTSTTSGATPNTLLQSFPTEAADRAKDEQGTQNNR